MTTDDGLSNEPEQPSTGIDTHVSTLEAPSAGVGRGRRFGIAAIAVATLGAGIAGGIALLGDDDDGGNERVQVAAPEDDGTESAAAGSDAASSDGAGDPSAAPAFEYSTLPIDWQDVRLPEGVRWIEQAFATDDGVAIASEGRLWRSTDLETWTEIATPVTGGQNGHVQSWAVQGDVVALLEVSYDSPFAEPDAPDVDPLVEVLTIDGHEVEVTLGFTAQRFVVRDGTGATLADRSIDYTSSAHPTGILFGSEGSVRILDDAEAPLVELSVEQMQGLHERFSARFEEWEPHPGSFCGPQGQERKTVHASYDGGASWIAEDLAPPADLGELVSAYQEVQLVTDGSRVLYLERLSTHLNIECALEQADVDLDFDHGFGVSTDPDGITLDTDGVEQHFSYSDLGLSPEETALVAEDAMGAPQGAIRALGEPGDLVTVQGWGQLVGTDGGFLVVDENWSSDEHAVTALRSVDGGATWDEVALPESGHISTSGADLVLSGWEGTVHRSTDSGLTWERVGTLGGGGGEPVAIVDGHVLSIQHAYNDYRFDEPIIATFDAGESVVRFVQDQDGAWVEVIRDDDVVIRHDQMASDEGVGFNDAEVEIYDESGEVLVAIPIDEFEAGMEAAFSSVADHDMGTPEVALAYSDGDDVLYGRLTDVMGDAGWVTSIVAVDGGFLVVGEPSWDLAPTEAEGDSEEIFHAPGFGVSGPEPIVVFGRPQ